MELILELIQAHMAQKPLLWVEADSFVAPQLLEALMFHGDMAWQADAAVRLYFRPALISRSTKQR
jgi:hypothetical protein